MDVGPTQAGMAIGQRLTQRIGRWSTISGRFARTQPLGATGLVVLLILVLGAGFAPWVTGYSPIRAVVADRFLPPGTVHWLGTDELGRDLFTRILYGARISLFVSFTSVFLGTTIGYLIGIVSGYVGGKGDIFVQRVVDAMLAFPSLLLALTVVSVLGAGIDKVIFAISVTTAPRASRVSRGIILALKESVYVDAARVIGASHWRIMLIHLLPNSMAPYLVLASVGLGGAILTEASLSFLGLGVPPPHPSWGRMLTGAAQQFAIIAPWMLVAPGVALSVVVLAFNFFGDALRDLWDPKLRGRI